MSAEIIFNQNATDNKHYRSLKKKVDAAVKDLPKTRILKKQIVTFFFIALYVLIYFVAMRNIENVGLYYSLYVALGVVIVFIFLNIIHDAVHNHVFKKQWANNAILLVFDFMGANSYIWKNRHIKMHHNYQNIMGWDSDIEQAGPVKIYPAAESKPIHRKQHWLVFFMYPLYLFNWVLIRDFKDFFQEDRCIKKKLKDIPKIEFVKLFFFKFFFVFYLLFVPILMGQKTGVAIGALLVMLVVGSLIALTILLTAHPNLANEFPVPDEHGKMPNSWLEHQFITTNDVTMDNWFSRVFMGNFNYHIVHHILPNVNSVYAPEATQVIKEFAQENGFEYKSMSMWKALKEHYLLIKTNAQAAAEFDILEEDM
ncbi:fatty acid desaturase family protein [Cognatitamlana onchidii]|uniref:fatty acid desaturase family protein n=1 Tax=Cognatitamlana onchidii TaxID=2562860 RepID=UPI00196B7355|nr:fatty acid desaturase [Algibacter onchidii]